MAKMKRYHIPGPIDVPVETDSGLDLLPTNITLIPLTLRGKSGSLKPEVVPKENSSSTADVMEYVKPEVKTKLKTGDKEQPFEEETILFRKGIESFTPRKIKENSKILRRLESEYRAADKLVENIDGNAMLRRALDNEEGRKALIACLKNIVDELEESLGDEI